MDDDTDPGLAISPLMQFREAMTHDTIVGDRCGRNATNVDEVITICLQQRCAKLAIGHRYWQNDKGAR